MGKRNRVKNIFLKLLPLPILFLMPAKLKAQPESNRVTELKQKINNTTNDTALSRLYGLLAWELKFTDKEEAINLADKEIAIATKYKNNLLLADGYRIKALTLVIDERIAEGMALYDAALTYAKKAGSLYYQASCYSLMGGMYGDHGDYHKAIEFYSKGLEVAIKSGDAAMIATLGNNLAESYQSDNRETELTQKYFLMALDNSIKIKNWPVACMNSSNLANEYIKNGLNDKAKIELSRSINLLNNSAKNDYQFATNSHVLASIFYQLGNLKEAEKYALVSLHIMDSLQRPDNAMRPLTVLTNIYIKNKNLEKADIYANRMLKDALFRNAKLYIRDGYKALSDIERQKNNSALALKYFELYKSWNDSVFEISREQSISNIETRSKLAQKELEVKYQTEEKKKENEHLKKRNENLQQEKILAIVSCIIFIVLGLMLYFSNRRKQKINAELQTEKKIVEQQALEKGMLVHEIHHRVKNNLTILKSLLYLQAKAANNNETKRILEECQSRIQSMAIVHQNLYGESNNGNLDLVLFLESLFDELSVSFRPEDKTVDFQIDGNCRNITITQTIPLGLIMNELVTNSLKYAFKEIKEGLIQLDIKQENKKLIIHYSDNGPGLQTEFDLAKGGFGFKVLNILAQQLNAKITYQKEINGSVFRIEVPF